MEIRQLIITIAIILCASTSWAMRLGFLGAIVAGGTGGCSIANNEVGVREVGATTQALNTGYVWVYRVQADCSGPLNTAAFYQVNTAGANVLIGVYTSNNATFSSDTGMNLVGYTTINGGGNPSGWRVSSGMTSPGSVVAGQYYWLMIAASESTYPWDTKRNAETITLWYKDVNGDAYTTPPASLSATGFSSASLSFPAAYISIGN